MRISLHLSLCCTSTSAITSNNPIVVSYTFEMPNATTTRMLCDCQSFSRELQIFHDKTCQFFLARCMISNLFTGTVSFKLKTAFFSYCLFKIAMSFISDVVYDSCNLHIPFLCNIHHLKAMLLQRICL